MNDKIIHDLIIKDLPISKKIALKSKSTLLMGKNFLTKLKTNFNNFKYSKKKHNKLINKEEELFSILDLIKNDESYQTGINKTYKDSLEKKHKNISDKIEEMNIISEVKNKEKKEDLLKRKQKLEQEIIKFEDAQNIKINKEPISKKVYNIKEIKEPKNKSSLKTKIAKTGIVTILALALLSSPVTKNKNNINDLPITNDIVIEQNSKSLNQETSRFEFEINDDLLVDNTFSEKDIQLGGKVFLKESTPIFKTALDASLKSNPEEQYFKDNDIRYVHAITYKEIKDEEVNFITVWNSDPNKDVKLEEINQNNLEVVSVLVDKEEYKTTNEYEGFKSVSDVYTKEKEFVR